MSEMIPPQIETYWSLRKDHVMYTSLMAYVRMINNDIVHFDHISIRSGNEYWGGEETLDQFVQGRTRLCFEDV